MVWGVSLTPDPSHRAIPKSPMPEPTGYESLMALLEEIRGLPNPHDPGLVALDLWSAFRRAVGEAIVEPPQESATDGIHGTLLGARPGPSMTGGLRTPPGAGVGRGRGCAVCWPS